MLKSSRNEQCSKEKSDDESDDELGLLPGRPTLKKNGKVKPEPKDNFWPRTLVSIAKNIEKFWTGGDDKNNKLNSNSSKKKSNKTDKKSSFDSSDDSSDDLSETNMFATNMSTTIVEDEDKKGTIEKNEFLQNLDNPFKKVINHLYAKYKNAKDIFDKLPPEYKKSSGVTQEDVVKAVAEFKSSDKLAVQSRLKSFYDELDYQIDVKGGNHLVLNNPSEVQMVLSETEISSLTDLHKEVSKLLPGKLKNGKFLIVKEDKVSQEYPVQSPHSKKLPEANIYILQYSKNGRFVRELPFTIKDPKRSLTKDELIERSEMDPEMFNEITSEPAGIFKNWKAAGWVDVNVLNSHDDNYGYSNSTKKKSIISDTLLDDYSTDDDYDSEEIIDVAQVGKNGAAGFQFNKAIIDSMYRKTRDFQSKLNSECGLKITVESKASKHSSNSKGFRHNGKTINVKFKTEIEIEGVKGFFIVDDEGNQYLSPAKAMLKAMEKNVNAAKAKAIQNGTNDASNNAATALGKLGANYMQNNTRFQYVDVNKSLNNLDNKSDNDNGSNLKVGNSIIDTMFRYGFDLELQALQDEGINVRNVDDDYYFHDNKNRFDFLNDFKQQTEGGPSRDKINSAAMGGFGDNGKQIDVDGYSSTCSHKGSS